MAGLGQGVRQPAGLRDRGVPAAWGLQPEGRPFPADAPEQRRRRDAERRPRDPGHPAAEAPAGGPAAAAGLRRAPERHTRRPPPRRSPRNPPRPLLPGEVPGSEIFHVSLRDVRSGYPDKDMRLEAGDTVYLPKAAQIYVMGHVARPGAYRFEEGLTVFQALRWPGARPSAARRSACRSSGWWTASEGAAREDDRRAAARGHPPRSRAVLLGRPSGDDEAREQRARSRTPVSTSRSSAQARPHPDLRRRQPARSPPSTTTRRGRSTRRPPRS